MESIVQVKAGANCYLVTQGDSSILVDTGLKGNEKKILQACQGKHVKLIVLTHGHMDHIQNAAYLAKELQVPIAMHQKDVALVEDNLCRDMKARGFLGNLVRLISVKSAKHTQLQQFQPAILLKEGDKLQEYGIDAEILELPGHTAGSIGVKIGEHLLVGDALINMFKPSCAILYENWQEAQASAKRIENIGKLRIYFGHGNPVENRKWVN